MWAAKTMPISEEKTLGSVVRGVHTTHSCNGQVYLQLSSPASYVLNVHLKGGKENTHKKSVTEHSRLPPSKPN